MDWRRPVQVNSEISLADRAKKGGKVTRDDETTTAEASRLEFRSSSGSMVNLVFSLFFSITQDREDWGVLISKRKDPPYARQRSTYGRGSASRPLAFTGRAS